MAKTQKQTPKIKTNGPQASHSSTDKNLTCSEVQLDDLFSEGESTGPLRSRAKDPASRASTVNEAKPKEARSGEGGRFSGGGRAGNR